MLSHLLHLAGIESVILECRSRQYIEDRVRAGVLEQGTVDLMIDTGVGERLQREGLRHDGVWFSFGGRRHRINLSELTGGQRDHGLRAAGSGEGSCPGTRRRGRADCLRSRRSFRARSRFAASEDSLPQGRRSGRTGLRLHRRLRRFSRHLPAVRARGHRSRSTSAFIRSRWLGILAEAAPTSEELVYTYNQRGFALFSMRSPQITRLYLQCTPDEDLAAVARRPCLGRDAHAHDRPTMDGHPPWVR